MPKIPTFAQIGPPNYTSQKPVKKQDERPERAADGDPGAVGGAGERTLHSGF